MIYKVFSNVCNLISDIMLDLIFGILITVVVTFKN